MSSSRQYELTYIVSPEASEQEVADLHAQVEATIARLGGELAKSDNWGRRKLAYEIGPHKEGVYVLELINGSGELMKELERRLRVSERILRFLVVRVDEELRAADRARSRRRVSLRQAAEAAGLAAPAAPRPDDMDGGDGEEAEVR
jgi:small subunit ribosomal protein S6